jgi:hypothetical protein
MIPQLGFTEEVRLEMAWEGGIDALPGREGRVRHSRKKSSIRKKKETEKCRVYFKMSSILKSLADGTCVFCAQNDIF